VAAWPAGHDVRGYSMPDILSASTILITLVGVTSTTVRQQPKHSPMNGSNLETS
jgi:hypothetical protein